MASPFTPPTIPGAQGYPLGLTGATAATRYVGATASGAPASGPFAVGDFVIDQTGKVYVCTVAGTPGTWTAAGGSSSAAIPNLPTGALAQTTDRDAAMNTQSLLLTTRVHLVALYLPTGLLVTSVTFVSSDTAASVPVNQVFGLYDSARALLRSSVDDTTAAWAGATAKTLALTSTFTTTYTGCHYLAILVVATTVPSLLGTIGSRATAIGLAPILCGPSTSAVTALPANAAALTANSQMIYAYVS